MINKIKKFIFFIFCLFFILTCGKNKKIEKEKFLLGTYIKITVYDINKKNAELAINKAFEEMKRIDKNLSSYESRSDIFKINKNSNSYVKINEELSFLIKEALKTSDYSNGAYDISVKPLINLWGFLEKEKIKFPIKSELEDALIRVNYMEIKFKDNEIKIGKNQEIDTGSFLKGYAVYRARKILKENGIKSAFISSVSSLEILGNKQNNEKWNIAIQNPEKPEDILLVLSLKDRALGVSGDYQNYLEIEGKKYHHILNPKTGFPFFENKMLVIVSDNAFYADMYSTAFFGFDFKNLENISKKLKFDFVLVDKNMKVYYSENIKNYILK